MANVKWSDDAVFIPETSFDDGNQLMGLKGGVNAKFSRAVLFPNLSNAIFVSAAQPADGDGSITNPYLTIRYSDSLNTKPVIIFPGAYTDSNFFAELQSWLGSGKHITTYTISGTGTISIDDTSWQAATSPQKSIEAIAISGNINFSPSALKTNSGLFFNDMTANSITTNNSTQLSITNVTTTSISAGDHEVITISGCNAPTLTITYSGAVTPVSGRFTIKIVNNTGLSTVNLYPDGGGHPVDIFFVNNPNVATVNIDDSSAGGTTFYFDADSTPSGYFSDPNGDVTFVPLTNINYGVTTANGFSALNSEFAWDATNKVFTAGVNAHSSGGKKCTLLGRSTSSRDNVFVAAMDTGSDFFTNNIGQFAVLYTAGYAFGTGAPKAYFHAMAGTTGDLLLTAATVVADANIANSELNPYITVGDLTFKIRDSAGTLKSYAFSSYALLASPTFTGTLQANIGSFSVLYDATSTFFSSLVVGPYSSVTTLLVASDLISGTIGLTPVLAQAVQMPTAANIETALAAALGTVIAPAGNVPLNTMIQFSIENLSTTGGAVSTITTNTNIILVCNNGTPLIQISTGRSFKLIKSSSSPVQYSLWSN